jgi:hypothetical protein
MQACVLPLFKKYKNVISWIRKICKIVFKNTGIISTFHNAIRATLYIQDCLNTVPGITGRSVADPGCLYLIPDPNFFIPDPG